MMWSQIFEIDQLVCAALMIYFVGCLPQNRDSQYPCLELELEGELDRAGAANLVERVETAKGAAGAQAARQRLGRVAEQRAGQIVVGVAEVWVVEEVEELGAETKPHLLGEVKLPLERHIHLHSIETPQHVASEIALRPRGRFAKSRTIKNLPSRILGAVEHKRHPWIYVRPRIECCASRTKVKCTHEVIRRRRPGQDKTVQRPSSERGADKLLRSQGRQIIGHARREGMPDVKVGIPAVNLLIRTTAWRVDVRRKGVGRGIINRVGEGIRR